MRKSVLILAAYFAPESVIGAVRLTKVAKYLTRAGYAVTVLCDGVVKSCDPVALRDLDECGAVLRFGVRDDAPRFADAKQSAPPANRGAAKPSALRRFLVSVRNALRFYRTTRSMASAMKERLSRPDVDLSSFDVVLSTFTPLANHLCALWVKEQNPNVRFIADYRDPIDADMGYGICRYTERVHRKVLRAAAVLVGATQGYLSMMERPFFQGKSAFVYNGFDTDNLPEATPENPHAGQFCVLAMGATYGGRRDVSVVFRALADLLHEGRMKREKVRIEYLGAGSSKPLLDAKIAEYEIESLYHDRGRLSRDEAIKAQQNAQILVSSAWDTEDYHGVVPGKFFEQLLLRKPIVGVVLGTGVQSEMARLISRLRVGFCYEEGGGEASYEALKKYLLEAYVYYLARGKELYEPDEKQRAAFQYDRLIRQWIDLIEG